MGEMRVMGPEGDITIKWDPNDAESVAKAEAEFEHLKTAGMEFFTPGSGKGNRRRKKFDPSLGTIIAAPGVAKKEERKAAPGSTAKRPKAMRGGPVAARRPSR